MSQPVYFLAMIKGFTEAWYQLSQEEKDRIWNKSREIEKNSGSKYIAACNSRWANEGVAMWVVIEYPNMEAYQKKVEELEAMEWWRYIIAETILGTKIELD